jgi:hypothetical protein
VAAAAVWDIVAVDDVEVILAELGMLDVLVVLAAALLEDEPEADFDVFEALALFVASVDVECFESELVVGAAGGAGGVGAAVLLSSEPPMVAVYMPRSSVISLRWRCIGTRCDISRDL